METQNRIFASMLALLLAYPTASVAENAFIIASQGDCDYFIADGKRGLYLLSWYDGHRPAKDDVIIGDIGSYGTKDVYYPKQDREGRVCVEDYFLSSESAMKQLKDHCN